VHDVDDNGVDGSNGRRLGACAARLVLFEPRMNVLTLKRGIHEVGLAVRRPEELARRWRDRATAPDQSPPAVVFAVLLAVAILGLAAYGLTMGLHRGADAMLLSALKAPFAAGTAWGVTLPALYILNSVSGSKLDQSTTLLAALITCSFGSLAMLAGVPVNWFFTLALPWTATRWLVNAVIFAGVGVAMTDVFLRTMRALEPEKDRSVAVTWLLLIGVIGTELMVLVDLFAF
jgi:hypothetical protein